jgi:hypothetical protein
MSCSRKYAACWALARTFAGRRHAVSSPSRRRHGDNTAKLVADCCRARLRSRRKPTAPLKRPMAFLPPSTSSGSMNGHVTRVGPSDMFGQASRPQASGVVVTIIGDQPAAQLLKPIANVRTAGASPDTETAWALL